MKFLLALPLALCFCVALPQGKTKARISVKCAIMNTPMNVVQATKTKMFADYHGRRYFFCCPGCPDMFKKNPKKYAKADSIAAPKK